MLPKTLASIVMIALLGTSMPASAGSCPMDTTPDFTDDCYHEYILYDVDQAEVDVLILPPASPYYLRDVELLKASVEAWEDGIDDLAPSWLANGLNIHPYVVGLDYIPESALWDPEIIVVTGEVNPVLLAGVGLQSPLWWCHGVPPPGLLNVGFDDFATTLADQPDYHEHGQSGMLTASCGNGGATCFVVNTNFLWVPGLLTYGVADNLRDMYDLNSHEVGHCLGIGHVGDALDFKAKEYPEDDIMSYELDGHDPGRVLCVSTLNIRALEQVYGNLLGQSGYAFRVAGTYVHQDPNDWDDTSCSDPLASYLSLAPLQNADPLGPHGPP